LFFNWVSLPSITRVVPRLVTSGILSTCVGSFRCCFDGFFPPLSSLSFPLQLCLTLVRNASYHTPRLFHQLQIVGVRTPLIFPDFLLPFLGARVSLGRSLCLQVPSSFFANPALPKCEFQSKKFTRHCVWNRAVCDSFACWPSLTFSLPLSPVEQEVCLPLGPITLVSVLWADFPPCSLAALVHSGGSFLFFWMRAPFFLCEFSSVGVVVPFCRTGAGLFFPWPDLLPLFVLWPRLNSDGLR